MFTQLLRLQHTTKCIAATPCSLHTDQDRTSAEKMGILEKIAEIEREIARTQKNKGM